MSQRWSTHTCMSRTDSLSQESTAIHTSKSQTKISMVRWLLTEFLFQSISFQLRAKNIWIKLFYILFKYFNIQNYSEEDSNETKRKILLLTFLQGQLPRHYPSLSTPYCLAKVNFLTSITDDVTLLSKPFYVYLLPQHGVNSKNSKGNKAEMTGSCETKQRQRLWGTERVHIYKAVLHTMLG